MRTFALTLAFALTTLPALAGGISFELPTLTWPSDEVTTSTKDCVVSATVTCR